MRLNEKGQFVPISGMVMFTIVVLMVAVVNIYVVAKAKLQVQNLADAVAINIVTQMVSGINNTTDRNNWLNRFNGETQIPQSSSDPCPKIDKTKVLPAIICSEYAGYTGNFSFYSKDDATAYGRVVKAINDQQKIFQDSYNTFIGANGGIGQRALDQVMKDNIPILQNDPTIHIVTWNSYNTEAQAAQAKQNLEKAIKDGKPNSQATITPYMEPLQFALHDLNIAYDGSSLFGKQVQAWKKNVSLGGLMNGGQPVGWMELDTQHTPVMNVSAGGQTRTRIGAGAYVIKRVSVLGYPLAVTARSVAYMIPGSGKNPATSSASGPGRAAASRPEFKPTYWAKLGDQ